MNDGTTATFWEHLDVLRTVIIRSLAVVCVAAVAAFLLKEPLFSVLLQYMASAKAPMPEPYLMAEKHLLSWAYDGRNQ